MRTTFTPKTRFQSGPFAAEHLKWSRSEHSVAACEAAMAHFASTRKGADLMLLQGVADFVDILLNLAEPADKKQREDRSTLSYTAPAPQPRNHD